MTKIHIFYEGNLRCRLTHGPSGNVILTDAPVDNQGKGEAFSPTDLMASALASCMLTIMGIAARKINANIDGAEIDVEKEMINLPVRRIAKIALVFRMPPGIDPAKREFLEKAALTCPVHQSVHPDLQMPVQFHYPDY